MIRGRVGFLLVAPALLLLFFLTAPPATFSSFKSFIPYPYLTSWETDEPISDLASDREILQELRLPANFEYRRQCITVRPTKGLARSKMAHVASHRLLAHPPTSVSLDAVDQLPPCQQEIELDVPHFDNHARVDTSSLMLGVATSLKRINDSLPAFDRWLSHTGSVLLVLLVDQPDLGVISTQVEEIRSRAKDMGITLIFEPYTGSSESEGVRNFALSAAFTKNPRRNIKWYGLIDDDTFFISLPRVHDMLKNYDHTDLLYIGSLTEGHERIQREGFKAWGGGGFFISPPLLDIVAKNSEWCQQFDKGYGDILWRDCIYEVTTPTVQLTEVRGFNQIDMWGDISGFYESGLVPLLSVHHWKSWHLTPIPAAHVVADVAGPDSFLQRYLFREEDVVLTNGFSIVSYPKGLPNLDLAELTMVADVGRTEVPSQMEFHHSLGKTRPALEYGKEKVSWRFEQSVPSGKGDVVRQFYIKRAGQDSSVDSVIELDWRRG